MIVSRQYNAYFGIQCLQFWYWRENSLKNKLDVNLVSSNNNNSINLWTSNLTFPTQTWHRASVMVPFTALQNIVIQATHLGIENDNKSN